MKKTLPFWQHPAVLFALMAVSLATFIAYISSTFILDPNVKIILVLFTVLILTIFGYLIVTSVNKIMQAEKMQAEMVFVAAHQLRSPVSVFNGALSMWGNIKDSAKLISIMETAAQKMNQALDTFLDVGRLENGTFTLSPALFSLAKLTDEEIADFAGIARSMNIKLIFNPDPMPEITADKGRISMVIQNLIDNAIRYSPNGGGVEIKIENMGTFLKWFVSDQGIGVPENDRTHLFEKFYRAGNAKKTVSNGSGIGLYVAKKIINLSGGEIGFDPEQSGTTFYFTLPIIN